MRKIATLCVLVSLCCLVALRIGLGAVAPQPGNAQAKGSAAEGSQAATARAPAEEAQSDQPQAEKPAANLDGLDEFIRSAMQEWKGPGLAIAVVQDGKVVLSKGYGYRDVEKQLVVTPKTIFAIGSITKSFTVTALGMLADEGKLDWDKPVREYLPDFQLHDPVATQQMTARDLVTHRSGLPRHDPIWYGNVLSRKELYDRLRYLEPNKPFRSTWQYQNLMYMAAGHLAGQISGTSWEELVRARILDPLGMQNTNFSVTDSVKADDFALPYHKHKDQVSQVPFANIDAMGPAGSINSNVEAMIRYVQLHINLGKHEGKQLLSEANARQMQTPQMVMPGATQSPADEELGDLSYGMGFTVCVYRGQRWVEHGGGIDGFISLVSFLPRKKIGVVVLTNMTGSNPVPTIVTRRVFDRLLGLEPVDWAGRIREQVKKAEAAQQEAQKNSASARKEGTSPSHSLAEYAGTYEHPAYGRMTVGCDGSALSVTFRNISRTLSHFHYDIFETSEDPKGMVRTYKLTFLYNPQGEIDRVTVPLEPAVAEIVFKRLPDEAMRKKEFLEPLAGQYELALVTITVALKGEDTLTVTVPGQPTYELVPARGLSFDIKGLSGFRVEFKKDAAGAVSEVIFHQPNGSFTAKRKAAGGS